MHGGSTEKWGRRTITAHWKWDRSKAEGCVHLMGDLGIPRQWRLAKAEPNEGRRAALCAAATGDAAVKAATAARLSLFLCFYRWSSCCRTPHRGLKLQKMFTNLSSDSSRCPGEKERSCIKWKKNTRDPIIILYFLHVLPFSPWDSQFKPMSENTGHSM